MKNIRKLQPVLLAATIGALSPVALMLASSEVYQRWGYGKPDNIIKDISGALSFLFIMLAGLFHPNGPGNPYLINAVVGGGVFAAVALLWQFIRKE